MSTYHIGAFGCQMNARDSERIAGMLSEMGYAPAASEREADVVVYNTCAVRERAEARVFGRLGYLKHLKQTNRNLKIVLCGCIPQQPGFAEKLKTDHPYIDVALGTFNLRKLPELLTAAIESNRQIVDIWQTHDDWDELLPEKRAFPNKAAVNIMYGCDNYCAYCIVPYVRGRERSRAASDILAEIERLLADGVKEITLLGQNVNAYGRGLSEPINFAGLLRLAAKTGVESLKFLTSHPKDLSDELIETIANLDNVCKFVHLPAQSGSSETLRRMNRKYTKADYLLLIDKIRAAMPEASITTDLIVGFPGETEADFAETLDLARRVRFNGAYTFIYSKRSGTPAASMDGQIPHEVATERFKRLLDVINPIVHEINMSKAGKIIRILPESTAADEKTGLFKGRADDNTPVHFRANAVDWGFQNVRVTEGKPFYLLGEAAHE